MFTTERDENGLRMTNLKKLAQFFQDNFFKMRYP